MRLLPAFSASVLACASVCIAIPTPASAADDQVVFAYTGADQTWVVPDGVTAVSITMVGAGGAGARNGISGSAGGTGGGAGAVSGVVQVTPGDTLTIIVGQGGINDGVTNPRDRNYRYGGGASGAGHTTQAPPPDLTGTWGSGGGRTAVRSSAPAYGTAGDILTAGGGGGGGFSAAGGVGGGTTGGAGIGAGGVNASGGTQAAGGAAGAGTEPGVDGVAFAGGYAQLSGSDFSEGGGGGGGFFGGGGGGNNGGGGGGSSYLGTAAYFTGTTTAGSGATAGLTSWPAACGATPGNGGSTTVGSTAGSNGCVVIYYTFSSPEGAPPPWLQAQGRPTPDSPCPDGWNRSWAQWPDGGRGGYTCERRLQYMSGGWVPLGGFPN